MSTTGEIQREERFRDEWKQRWAARLRVESSIDEKLGWIEEQERRLGSLDLGWQRRDDIGDWDEHVLEILLEQCPRKLVVEIRMQRRDLEQLFLDPKQKLKFAQHFEEVTSVGCSDQSILREGYSGEPTSDAYKKWLLSEDQPQPPPQPLIDAPKSECKVL